DFLKAGIQFGDFQYNTYDKISQEVCLLSFYDLLEKGLLYKKEAEYLYCPQTKCSVAESELTEDGLYERSGIKPIIKKGEAYFIDMLNHKHEFLDAINKIEWKPNKYKKRLTDWIEGIKYDWCISRERHFGI